MKLTCRLLSFVFADSRVCFFGHSLFGGQKKSFEVSGKQYAATFRAVTTDDFCCWGDYLRAAYLKGQPKIFHDGFDFRALKGLPEGQVILVLTSASFTFVFSYQWHQKP